MIAAVGREQPELGPAFEDIVIRLTLKAANIMAPVTKTAQAERHPAPQRLGHRRIGRQVVPAPVHRELLAAGRRAAGKQAGLRRAVYLFQQLINCLVIQISIIVVHPVRVGTIMIDNPVFCGLGAIIGVLNRNPFAEIGLEGVNPHLAQLAEISLVPFDRFRVGKVDQSHSGLPHIPLPDAAVPGFDKIAMFQSFFEQAGLLGNIGVNPTADFDAAVMNLFEHPFRVFEGVFVPYKVGPLEFFHPEAVKMEDRQRDFPFQHPVDKGQHGLFIIIRCKRS